MSNPQQNLETLRRARLRCETEPFLRPDGIEPHGLLLVLDPDTLHVQQCSANVRDWLGIEVASLWERPFDDYLSKQDSQKLRSALRTGHEGPLPLTLKPVASDDTFCTLGSYAWLHQDAHQQLLLELEPRFLPPEQCPALHQQLLEALERLNRCTELQEFLDIATSEIRHFSGADQVAVFQFGIDDHGTVVAEERAGHMPSYLGLRFPSSDVPQQVRHHALQHTMRMTPDVQASATALCYKQAKPPQSLDLSPCQLRFAHPRARQYYQNMGIRSVLALSVVHEGRLWGYICALHPQPLLVDAAIRQQCQLITANVASQLSSRERFSEFHRQQHLQTLMEQILHRLGSGESWLQALRREQAALLHFMDAGGAAIQIADELLLLGSTPGEPEVRALVKWLMARCESHFCTEQLATAYPPAQRFSASGSGLLAVAMHDVDNWILWFRPELPRTVSWAGGSENDVMLDAQGEPVLHPRNSFNAWAELLQGTSQPFSTTQIHFAQEFCQWLHQRLRISQIVLPSGEQLPIHHGGQLHGLLNLTQDFLWRASLQDLSILYISPAVEAITGYPPISFLNDTGLWERLIHPTDREAVLLTLRSHTAGTAFDLEYRILHQDGDTRWLRNRGKLVHEERSQRYVLEGIATDISKQKLVEQQLHRQANYDALTGLPNRSLTLDRLATLCQGQRRQGARPFAVCFLDVNRFKWINDSLGHDAGDQVLIHVAEQLRQSLRPGDTVGRLGGDEFVILLPELLEMDHAVSVIQRIRARLAQPLEIVNQQLLLRVSIGIMAVDHQDWTPEQILAQADTAMYVAKRAGELYRFFEPAMMAESEAHLKLLNLVPEALEMGQFEIYYQPMVQLNGHTLLGFEALMRWSHPLRGVIQPGEFLPAIEHLPVFQQLGYHLLGCAATQVRCWNHQREVPLAIHLNISARQLQTTGFAQEVIRILQQHACDPQWICLEVTEDSLLSDTPTALQCLQRLNTHGVRVFLDDFGMGYSSLSYLHRFPISGVKIDRSLVATLTKNLRDSTIAQAIVVVAEALKMGVIAEGIEDIPTVNKLRGMGCDLGQGYLFSKPLPASEADIWQWRSQ